MKKKVIAPIGVRAIGAGGLQQTPPPPPNFGQLRYFGHRSKRNLGEANFYKTLHVWVFFSLKELFFILSLSRRCKGSYIGR